MFRLYVIPKAEYVEQIDFKKYTCRFRKGPKDKEQNLVGLMNILALQP